MRCWLNSDAIKPWQVRSWIFPRDPDFQAKAARSLDLHSRVWDGELSGPGEYVISDEKSQLLGFVSYVRLVPNGRVQRRQLNQSTQAAVVVSTCCRDDHDGALTASMSSVLNSPIVDSMSTSPTVPIEPAIPASRSCSLSAIEMYWDPASE